VRAVIAVNAPKPSEAVHASKDGRRSLCGQSMKGEIEFPPGTPITCPVCKRKTGDRW
jgi:hypothetical protein